jgi:hypothetical protein
VGRFFVDNPTGKHMTDQGDRAPKPESAASIAGRTAAIDAAFAEFPDFNDDETPSAVAPNVEEKPSGDDQADSASVETKPADKADEKTVSELERPVEGQPASPASKDPLEAPKHWPEDRRKIFQAQSDDVKRIILDRNKEANVAVTKAQQEAAQYRRTHEAVASAFGDDHRKQMAAAGLDEVGAIQYLLSQHDALNRDPVNFLKAVIKQTGVSAEALFGQAYAAQQQAAPAAQNAEEAAWRDPDFIALEKSVNERLAELQKAEDARKHEAAERQRQQQRDYNAWFNGECSKFETAMDDDGHAKYPHLPAVMETMTRLIKSDPAFDKTFRDTPQQALETVYNQAIRLNPDIYQQIQQELIEAQVSARLQAIESQNAVKKAQTANTRKGAPGANGQAQPRQRMSRDEAIAKAMADAGL